MPSGDEQDHEELSLSDVIHCIASLKETLTGGFGRREGDRALIRGWPLPKVTSSEACKGKGPEHPLFTPCPSAGRSGRKRPLSWVYRTDTVEDLPPIMDADFVDSDDDDHNPEMSTKLETLPLSQETQGLLNKYRCISSTLRKSERQDI